MAGVLLAESPPSTRRRLAELVSIEALQPIQDAFAQAFGLPTVIVDPDSNRETEFTHGLTSAKT